MPHVVAAKVLRPLGVCLHQPKPLLSVCRDGSEQPGGDAQGPQVGPEPSPGSRSGV